MTIQGTFYDIDNNAITVIITKDDGTNNTLTIGENGLYFTGDPISIETNMESTFDPIIRKSCTINLLTRNYIGDYLWAENAHNIRVELKRGTSTIFYGFVEPNTFSQPFVELDEFSINCIDVLSALQYYNYKGIKTVDTYKTQKANAATVTFRDLMLDSLSNALQDDITSYRVLYDRTKGLNGSRISTVFQDLGISETYLLGETFDDIWTCEDVVNQTLQYLNLHIIQQGKIFYIFDWDTLRKRRNSWYNLVTLANNIMTSASNVAITSDMHSANDTSITISDVYNQISVKCGMENIEDVISSPLDDDTLISPYTGKQLYMREYISEGNGTTALNTFKTMLREDDTQITYDDAKYIDWYVRVMTNPNWIFHTNNGTGNIIETLKDNSVTYSNGRYINQWKLPHTMHWNRLWCSILSFGSVERQARIKDNAPTAKVSMTDYLYIPINGNEVDDDTNSVPTVSDLQSHAPMIEYLGSNGGVFSPTDENITNYLVFSGKLLLQPLTKESKTSGDATGFSSLKQAANGNTFWVSPVPSENNGNGRYYTRKFFTTVNPSDKPNESEWLNDMSLQPWTKDKSNHLFQYQYSKNDKNGPDLVSKLPILECELIIGNKRLIEKNVDEWGNSTFEWVELGNEPTVTFDEDGQSYPITTFTLGVNPKLDDYIIGTEFDIQNTISIEMNVDAEGTAIPIRKSDNLSGAIQFKILGPVNTTWNQITRRHPTWFRHTQWSSENKLILAHLENIIIKDFSCKIYSNNALNETDGNDELIYMSDETTSYINKHDDTEFKFITQPTADQISEQQLNAGANINAVINMTDNTPLESLYNVLTTETAKAEEHFVNQYYNEYHIPRIEMQMTVHNTNKVNWRNTYTSNALGKSFYMVAMNEDVRNNTSTIKLKSKDI